MGIFKRNSKEIDFLIRVGVSIGKLDPVASKFDEYLFSPPEYWLDDRRIAQFSTEFAMAFGVFGQTMLDWADALIGAPTVAERLPLVRTYWDQAAEMHPKLYRKMLEQHRRGIEAASNPQS